MTGHIKYTAWYDPEFKLDSAEYQHAAEDSALREFVAELAADIKERGLRNPIQVEVKNGRTIIHPGKCRAKALISLGRETAPAIVINYDLPGYQANRIPQHCTALGKPSQVQRYFESDYVVQMSTRWLTIKKKTRWR